MNSTYRTASRRAPIDLPAFGLLPMACARIGGQTGPMTRTAPASPFDLPPRADCFGPDHDALRRSVAAFVAREISPFVAEWDEAGTFPRALYRQAADLGLLGLGYPEELGGTPADLFGSLAAAEEIARAGAHRRAGQRGAEAPRGAARAGRREDRCAGHHRARRRF
jgi:alkylation response protein AidB-like acyl-CoA dehydrogenase